MTLLATQWVHHARNRLMAVLGRLEAAGRLSDVAEIQKAANLLNHAIHAITIQRPEYNLSPVEVDVDEFFYELLQEAQQLAPSHILIQAQPPESTGLFRFWTFDLYATRTVLTDALMNAIRHAATTIRLSYGWQDGELFFSIGNDGETFPLAILESQGEQPLRHSHQGTGHGLHLAQQIARQHHSNGKAGHITLNNSPNGAIFGLFLP